VLSLPTNYTAESDLDGDSPPPGRTISVSEWLVSDTHTTLTVARSLKGFTATSAKNHGHFGLFHGHIPHFLL
jgi:hypothetical protein